MLGAENVGTEPEQPVQTHPEEPQQEQVSSRVVRLLLARVSREYPGWLRPYSCEALSKLI